MQETQEVFSVEMVKLSTCLLTINHKTKRKRPELEKPEVTYKWEE